MKTNAKTILAFDETPEGHYTDNATHDYLLGIYAAASTDVQKHLNVHPVSAADYINRFAFYVQSMAGDDADTQYNALHQLIRAYAAHAILTNYHQSIQLVPDTDGRHA